MNIFYVLIMLIIRWPKNDIRYFHMVCLPDSGPTFLIINKFSHILVSQTNSIPSASLLIYETPPTNNQANWSHTISQAQPTRQQQQQQVKKVPSHKK